MKKTTEAVKKVPKKVTKKKVGKKSKKKVGKNVAGQQPPNVAVSQSPLVQQASPKNSQSQKTTVNYSFFFVLLVIGLFAGFFWMISNPDVTPPEKPTRTQVPIPDYEGKDVKFDEALALLKIIDLSYGVDYHEEKIAGKMVKVGKIPQIIAEFTVARDSFNKSIGEEKKAILRLYDARVAQLKSELAFQRALSFGKKGSYTVGFNCKDRDTLLKATDFYNESLTWGIEANKNFDLLLAEFLPARQSVGTDDNKPNWFYSPLGEITRIIEVNIIQIDKFCPLE